MSFAASPVISLDLRTDWIVVGSLAAWAGLLLTCLWQSTLPVAVLAALSAPILLVVGAGIDGQLHGISPRAPTGARRTQDGEWSLRYAQDVECTVNIRSAKPFPGGFLLVFRQGRRLRWLLLRAGPTNGGELRKLRVLARLRT
jgi:hypothetical protein